jgi:hypothetical protein
VFSHSVLTGIAEVLDPKVLREGMNRQDTYREGQKADDQLAKFYFSQQALYKRGRDLNIKTLDLVTTFLCFPPCILTAGVLD